MKFVKTNFFPLAVAATLSGGAFAADDAVFVQLTCSASAQPKQPCGGTNTRRIGLMISGEKTSRANGFREAVSYGGCYPISDDSFGSVENVRKEGDEIRFDLRRKGSMWGSVPVVYENSEVGKAVPARLNLKTKELQLDTTDVFWPYAKPDALNCKSVH